MEGGGLVREAVDDRAQLVLFQTAERRERVESPLPRVGADEVELGAIARRQAGCLAVAGQLARSLGRQRQRNEGALAHRDRRCLV